MAGGDEVIVGDGTVSWTFGGNQVVVPQDPPPRSACLLSEQGCVVIVEESGDTSNAVVYELDGTERLRPFPPPGVEAIGYDQVFADADGVVAVFAFRFNDKWGRPDVVTGEVSEWRDWR